MADYPTSFIRAALREGRDAESAYSAFTGAGGELEKSAFMSAFGNVVRALAQREAQGLGPLNRRPTADEITRLPGTRGKGYLYQIEIQVKGKETGVVESLFYGIRSRRTIARGRALDAAIADFQANAEQYGEEVLGGVLTGVYELGGT